MTPMQMFLLYNAILTAFFGTIWRSTGSMHSSRSVSGLLASPASCSLSCPWESYWLPA